VDVELDNCRGGPKGGLAFGSAPHHRRAPPSPAKKRHERRRPRGARGADTAPASVNDRSGRKRASSRPSGATGAPRGDADRHARKWQSASDEHRSEWPRRPASPAAHPSGRRPSSSSDHNRSPHSHDRYPPRSRPARGGAPPSQRSPKNCALGRQPPRRARPSSRAEPGRPRTRAVEYEDGAAPEVGDATPGGAHAPSRGRRRRAKRRGSRAQLGARGKAWDGHDVVDVRERESA